MVSKPTYLVGALALVAAMSLQLSAAPVAQADPAPPPPGPTPPPAQANPTMTKSYLGVSGGPINVGETVTLVFTLAQGIDGAINNIIFVDNLPADPVSGGQMTVAGGATTDCKKEPPPAWKQSTSGIFVTTGVPFPAANSPQVTVGETKAGDTVVQFTLDVPNSMPYCHIYLPVTVDKEGTYDNTGVYDTYVTSMGKVNNPAMQADSNIVVTDNAHPYPLVLYGVQLTADQPETGITLSKTVSPTVISATDWIGQPDTYTEKVTFTYKVTNLDQAYPVSDLIIDENPADDPLLGMTKFRQGDLTGVSSAGALPGCPDTAIPPGGSIECTATYEVTKTDVDNYASIANTALAKGNINGDPVTSGRSRATLYIDNMVVTKEATALNSVTTPTPTASSTADEITWTVTVKNTGGTRIEHLTLADELDSEPATLLNNCTLLIDPPPVPDDYIDSAGYYLAPGYTLMCTYTSDVTPQEISAKSAVNLVNVTGVALNTAVKNPGPGDQATVIGSAHAEVPVVVVTPPNPPAPPGPGPTPTPTPTAPAAAASADTGGSLGTSGTTNAAAGLLLLLGGMGAWLLRSSRHKISAT